ncbi:MAG: NHLP bacteriocin system secretion protein [Legionella sp.]|nr:NHLP bacteriocin system secretion protein [Legionella sp.]
MDKIFRKKSLSRLNNPEKLNNLFKIVSPQNWIILTALLILLTMIVIWSIWGSVTTIVSGNGILINSGQNIYDAMVEYPGRIVTVEVSVGDVVKKGDILATLRLPLLTQEIQNKQEVLASLELQRSNLQQFIAKDFKLEQQNNEVLRQNWTKDLNNVSVHLIYLKKALDEREKLVDKVISRQELAELRSNYYKELRERDELSKRISELAIEFKRRTEANQQRLIDLNNRILQTQLELTLIQKKFKINSVVTSPVDGEIINVIGKAGEVVQAGYKILDIEPYAENVDAAIYVPAGMGKVIAPGMMAQVVPKSVKRQEYGSIEGVVEAVSRFPSSQKSMMAVLANEKLVESFTADGPQLYIRINLTEADTPSHFKWTTSRGPNMVITNGTICTADIITKNQPPITLLIPAIKHFLGID